MAPRHHSATGALIAVDWGTSRLRATLIDATGHPVAEAESGDGINQINDGHEQVFERLVMDWPPVPAIMAGMVGSRQGWHEAAYLACPTTVDGLAQKTVRFATARGRAIVIVPGLMARSKDRDGDVMRGEETQIVGLVDREPRITGTCIMPGTHSKWVHLENGSITGFQTFMTGELFGLLARQSFLRHSVAESGSDLAEVADFALGVKRTAADGLPFLSAIFSVRTRQLLDRVAPEDNLAYLSGLVIGGEIAAARAAQRLDDGALRIVGDQSLARAYRKALAILGHHGEIIDGDEMALAGLVHLARSIGLIATENAP